MLRAVADPTMLVESVKLAELMVGGLAFAVIVTAGLVPPAPVAAIVKTVPTVTAGENV
jgi:hypothetical protein